MFLSVITYAVFLCLILWGVRFAGFGRFNDDYVSLESTKALRGLAAIAILLHHISQQEAFQNAGVLAFFNSIGIYAVAVFMFCSGFGLVKSYKVKANYLDGFIRRRVVKTLVIPFYVNVLLYAAMMLVTKAPLMKGQWVSGFLGWGLFNEYAWFPVVLSFLYLTFYLVYAKAQRNAVRFSVIGLVIAAMAGIFFLIGHFPWIGAPANWWMADNAEELCRWWMVPKFYWFTGEWWVNTNIVFLVGIIYGEYEERITCWLKEKYALKLLLCAVLFVASLLLNNFAMRRFGYWTEFRMNGPEHLCKLITFCGQLPHIVLFIPMLLMIRLKCNSVNPVTRFFGNISFETYMMNFMAISIFVPVFLTGTGGEPAAGAGIARLAGYELCVLAASVMLGLIYKKLHTFICKAAGI